MIDGTATRRGVSDASVEWRNNIYFMENAA